MPVKNTSDTVSFFLYIYEPVFLNQATSSMHDLVQKCSYKRTYKLLFVFDRNMYHDIPLNSNYITIYSFLLLVLLLCFFRFSKTYLEILKYVLGVYKPHCKRCFYSKQQPIMCILSGNSLTCLIKNTPQHLPSVTHMQITKWNIIIIIVKVSPMLFGWK